MEHTHTEAATIGGAKNYNPKLCFSLISSVLFRPHPLLALEAGERLKKDYQHIISHLLVRGSDAFSAIKGSLICTAIIFIEFLPFFHNKHKLYGC